MPAASRQFGELRRLFFGRFLDNDLISLEGDAKSVLASVLGLLAAQGLFLPFFEFLTLSSWPLGWQSWDTRDLAALPDKALHIGLSLTVIGIVTVLEWDALLPDRRDIGVLRPLPIPLATLLGAKIAALAQFWLIFCAMVSALPAVLLPAIILQSGNDSLLPRFIAAHAISVLAANACIFLFVIAIQSLLLLCCGYRLYRRVSPWVQGLLLAALLSCFFFSLGIPFDLENGGVITLLPAVWFVGLYQALLGWPHEIFRELAGRALAALGVVSLAAVCGYALSYRRIVAQSFEALEAPATAHARWRWLPLLNGAERAAFYFVSSTLLRSRTHRMLVLGWFGVGLALVFQGVSGMVAAGRREWWTRPEGALLPAAAILWLCLIVGLRYAVTIPAELRANWVFQTAGALDVRGLMTGVRKAILPLLLVPLAVVLFPLHALAWGWRLAAFHVAFHAALAWVLAECLLAGLDKLPFTCSYAAGKSDLKSRWWLYLISYLAYVAALTSVESWLLERPAHWPLPFIAAALVLAALHWRRRRVESGLALRFDDRPDPAVQTLELA